MDRTVLKVLHGATEDIKWLQRDFSLYVVNLFDTFQAAQCLNLKGKSLQFLLETYCDEVTDKRLRMTDWRVRPLRPELGEYARKDTRYLLFLMDHFTNLLLEHSTTRRDLLSECYARSADTALIVFRKKRFDPRGWTTLCRKKGWFFVDHRSLSALSKLYEWRDRIGRSLDQSVDAVLSNPLLKRMVSSLPQTAESVLNLEQCSLSAVARRYHQDIADLVQLAIHDADDESKRIDPLFDEFADGEHRDGDALAVDER